MLDSITKGRINTARDILVGKVPDPKSQVEQITIALIYKFMDDMDLEAEELGGKRTFFSGEFAKYSWRKIFDPRQGGHELLNLYGEAITKMDTNPGVPKLFRDIFKNAYLPYRDPETLKSFLKIINEFDYSHSEKLGDAFEYLLSILGSQGDAGQFRTPRHIIDFMVEIIDPKKHEIILDPACGTAGFLISSYKHIIKQNSSNYLPDDNTKVAGNGSESVNEVIISSNGYSGELLTADERKVLADNMHGFDISPDMVRLSLVNMYLHGIKEPKIYEYDSLTSEDHWNEYSDVILANPPFMSPKGGIRPHNRFSVQSNRSEVLFVDYIAEHLTPDGRSAVIVPEGIIFQSGNAYKQLRKMLVEKYLVGVISLPAGVFQPYSGVKTSILWLDKALAKKTDKILFIKIANDGFDLGAQRRAVKGSNLPYVIKKIADFRNTIELGKQVDNEQNSDTSLVPKSQISGNSEYNLSGERYIINATYRGNWDTQKLESICYKITDGSHNPPPSTNAGMLMLSSQNIYNHKLILDNVRYLSEDSFNTENRRTDVKPGDVLLTIVGTIGRCLVVDDRMPRFALQRSVAVLKPNEEINSYFLSYMLLSDNVQTKLASESKGVAQKGIYLKELKSIEIPVPPIPIQLGIVAEIEGYQKIIDGARQVVENYKPRIDIDPEWEMVELGEVCKLYTGGTPRSTEKQYYEGGDIRWLVSGDIHNEEIFDCEGRITEDGLQYSNARYLPINSVLIALNGQGKTRGTVALLRVAATCNQSIVAIDPIERAKLLPEFLYLQLKSKYQEIRNITGDNQRSGLNMPIIRSIKIYLPEISIQTMLVNEYMQDITMVRSSKALIERFTMRIKDRIAKVWGE